MPSFCFLILFLAVLAFAQGERRDLLGEVQISKIHSLDESKGTYKSPKRALFMSLVLPGTGQLYVGGKQSRYIRGTFYLAEEAALISGFYYHSIYKYDKQVKKYQDFAKDYFSVTKYETSMNEIYPADPDTLKKYYGQEQESYCKAFYGNTTDPCVKDFGVNSSNRPNDNTPLYNSTAYYSIIANENFVLGWKDAKPNESLGTSDNRNEYLSMRKKATKLADRQAIFLGAIILNHIVSAVDAALSARAHNGSLYEEKISFLDNIRLGSDFQLGENFKAGAGLWYNF